MNAQYNELSDFIASECAAYGEGAHNRIAFASANVIRGFGFVAIVSNRYARAAALFSASANAFMSLDKPNTASAEALWWRHEASMNEQGTIVQLEIESFYLFSKIFLDRLAQLLHWWFSDQRSARGTSINRHSRLVERLDALAAQAGLTLPPDMIAVATDLQQRISDYRDHEITHDISHTFKATSWNATSVSIMSTGRKAVASPAMSANPMQLLVSIRLYVALVGNFLASNREKSKLFATYGLATDTAGKSIVPAEGQNGIEE